MFVTLLTFLETQAQTSCKDSLLLAMRHGRVLVRNIALRDSLLAIRMQSLATLSTQNLQIRAKNDSLLKSNLLLCNKLKKGRTKRNALGFLFLIGLGILIVF